MPQDFHWHLASVHTISCHALVFVTAVSTLVLGRRKESSDIEEGYLTAARAKTHIILSCQSGASHSAYFVVSGLRIPSFCSITYRPGQEFVLLWRNSDLSFGLIAQLKTLIYEDQILLYTVRMSWRPTTGFCGT